MHELSICEGLMTKVEQVALENGAASVETIFLSVGPLSGIEPSLLKRAFEISRLGTIAESAELDIQTGPIIVECGECSASSEVRLYHLVCGSCGNWRVRVTQGEELLLLSLELSGIPDDSEATQPDPRHSGSAQPQPRHSGSAQPHPESTASIGEPPHV
jgi:hydrogenase nickel incorporation protein HypA/HybF